MAATKQIEVFLPDTRGVEISRYGMGNAKIGFNVFTYSRLAGREFGTCPGSSDECEDICYAKRIAGAVLPVYLRNSPELAIGLSPRERNDVPPIPEACELLRLHVSGDFDTVAYIEAWIERLTERPDVTCWAYTKSWRVPELLPALERLRALPNVQLFASMDASMPDVPPLGWRRAWTYRNPSKIAAAQVCGKKVWPLEVRLSPLEGLVLDREKRNQVSHRAITVHGGREVNTASYVCPEETGYKKDCVSCGYCFEGKRNDVTFLEH